jgi:hypothetical protein
LVLATADFNTDGFFDLAIGSPTATIDNVSNRGDVLILYGSRDGLRIDGIQQLLPDESLGAARFGFALAAGAYNSDPLIDLAIGAPGAFDGSGAVIVYHGAFFAELELASELVPPVGGAAAIDFGAALATGAFSAPSFGFGGDELVISARRHSEAGEAAPGVLYRASADLAAGGLVLAAAPAFDLATLEGVAADGALTASLLIPADFNGDGIDDLAIGLPTAGVTIGGENLAGAGAVALLHGTAEGFISADIPLLLQDMLGFRDEIEAEDGFGMALAAGDFDDDGIADIAVGTPLEDDAGQTDRGVIHFAYGSPAGLDPARRTTVNHDMSSFGPIIGTGASGDLFGAALGVGDFDGDGFHELAIGISGKPGPDGLAQSGWVLVLHGSRLGATTAYARPVNDTALAGAGATLEDGNYLGLAVTGGTTNCATVLCARPIE